MGRAGQRCWAICRAEDGAVVQQDARGGCMKVRLGKEYHASGGL